MDRLTFEGNFCDIAKCLVVPGCCGGTCSPRKVWERLKKYEDAEEQGRLVALPCGINDTAWYADEDADRVLMGYVSSYQILSDGAIYFEFTNVESDVEWVSVELPVEDFGKAVFLTQEEAEAALAADKNVGHTIPVNDLYDEDGGDVRKGGDKG